jgi:tetratricopeptide (TPR) repeat protein
MFFIYKKIIIMIICFVFICPFASNSYADYQLEKAKENYRHGFQAFQSRDYENAIFYFQKAYELRQFNDFYYNMGCCYDLSRDYDTALYWYGTYLHFHPTAWAAESVRRRIYEIENAPTVKTLVDRSGKGDNANAKLEWEYVKQPTPGYFGVQNATGAFQ